MDILVCGGCHGIFHFVNEFESHKDACKGATNKHKVGKLLLLIKTAC